MNLRDSFRSIVNPSGGLSYHYSAFRHKRFHWAPFVAQLNEWLLSWPHNGGSLLLIGPSGGYTLSDSFLQNFSQIDAIDPDPVAKKLFLKNHSHPQINWHDSDFFGTKSKTWNPKGLGQLLNLYPDHKILFCNFLGQLAILFPELSQQSIWLSWKKEFQITLQGRKWLSYHDLYSTTFHSRKVDTDILKRWERDQNREPNFYLEKLFAQQSPKKRPTVVDHCTNELFPAGRRRLFLWQRLPKYLHIIEGRRTA